MMFSSKSFLIPLALQIALHAASSSAVLVVDWSSYPPGAVNCLNAAQGSANCPSADVASFNGCVCKNGNGFLQSAATCLGTSDAGDVTGVYNQLNTNCGGTGDPLNINQAQWNSWASPAATTPAPVAGTTVVNTVAPTAATQTSVVTLAANSNTIISTVTIGSSAGVGAKTSVITVAPGQTTMVPGIITVAASGATNTPSSSSSSGSKLGIGAIVGIAVGGAVVIAIIGLIAVLLLRRGGSRNNQPSTTSPAFAAAAVPPAAPMSDAGMGPSPGLAQAEPYKNDRPVSSIPSTNSPDPYKRVSAMGTPQGGYASPGQQYGMQQGYQYPQGQYPQESPMPGYAQQPYPGSPYAQGSPVPYGAQNIPPQQYVPHPGQQYSELSSESAPEQQRVELPGGPQ